VVVVEAVVASHRVVFLLLNRLALMVEQMVMTGLLA